MLSWARGNGCPWDNDSFWGDDTCTGAAAAGRLYILQWARTGLPTDVRDVLRRLDGTIM